MKIVVTGSSGALGASAAARLAADSTNTVRGFDQTERRLGGVTTERLDLLATPPEFRWPDGIEVVLHLAGSWEPAAGALGVAAQLRANVELVARALAACGPSVRRFVYVSSMSVYGPDATVPFREDAVLRPDSFYGRTKWLGEQVCRVAQEVRPDLAVVVLRLAQVYGPGTPPRVVLYEFIDQALATHTIRAQCSSDLMRDHIYITDAVEAIVLAATDAPAGTYNVSGGGQTMGELATAIRDASRPLSVTFDGVPGVPKAMDPSAFRAATGFVPRTLLQEGIQLEVERLTEERR